MLLCCKNSTVGPPYYPVKTRSPYPLARSDVEQDAPSPPFSSVDGKKYPEPIYSNNGKHGSSHYPEIPSERSHLLNHN